MEIYNEQIRDLLAPGCRFTGLLLRNLSLSLSFGDAIWFTIHTHYGNLISVPKQQPSLGCVVFLVKLLV